jgi:hypothetical protein
MFDYFTRFSAWRRDVLAKRLRPPDVVFFTLLCAVGIASPYLPAVKISVTWIALSIVLILMLTYRLSEASRAAWGSD